MNPLNFKFLQVPTFYKNKKRLKNKKTLKNVKTFFTSMPPAKSGCGSNWRRKNASAGKRLVKHGMKADMSKNSVRTGDCDVETLRASDSERVGRHAHVPAAVVLRDRVKPQRPVAEHRTAQGRNLLYTVRCRAQWCFY